MTEITFNLKQWKKTVMEAALTKANGNVTRASELLGIDRRTLQRNLGLHRKKSKK